MEHAEVTSMPGYKKQEIKCCLTCGHSSIHSCDFDKNLWIGLDPDEELGICDNYIKKEDWVKQDAEALKAINKIEEMTNGLAFKGHIKGEIKNMGVVPSISQHKDFEGNEEY